MLTIILIQNICLQWTILSFYLSTPFFLSFVFLLIDITHLPFLAYLHYICLLYLSMTLVIYLNLRILALWVPYLTLSHLPLDFLHLPLVLLFFIDYFSYFILSYLTLSPLVSSYLSIPFHILFTAHGRHNEGSVEHTGRSHSCISCTEWCYHCLGSSSKKSMVCMYQVSYFLNQNSVIRPPLIF